MALRQLADNPMMGNFEQKLHSVFSRLKAFPASFWRNLIVGAALLWICLSLASLFWVVFPTPDVPEPPKVAAPVESQTKASAAVAIDLEGLKSRQLFGDASGVADLPLEPIQQEVKEDVAKTRLNLKLAGVLMSSDPKQSTAIIASGSEQKVYKVNEKLKAGNNVKLAKVLPDKVILDNNGRFEALWLYSEVDFKSSSSSSSSGSSRAASSNSERKAGPVNRTIAADRVPKSINEVIRFSVYREEGKMLGYRIRPGRDRELFEELGLKANDIVTSVNGVTVDDPQQIRKNYQALKTATEANLEILRDGEVISINVSLDTGE